MNQRPVFAGVAGGDCSVTSSSTMESLELGPSTAGVVGGREEAPFMAAARRLATSAKTSPPVVVVPKAWENEGNLLDNALNEVLRRTGVLANLSSTSPQQQPHDELSRHRAVSYLQRMLDKWIPRPSVAGDTKSLPANPWNRSRPTLITFGSFRLGVHRMDSDLDVLALCPPEFSRGEFFSSWVDLLKKDKSISKVHAIPGAYTPVIKFMFESKIHVDMLFARVADGAKLRSFQETRPPLSVLGEAEATTMNAATPRIEYKIDDSDLKEQDEAGVRSLNGARVSQMLLEMVPNLDSYRKVLRAVKEWAVTKGIYSNVLGFLGGVNFAILVAYVCRECPTDDPPALLRHFFRIFSQWTWPEPVTLVPIESVPPKGAPFMPAWDPVQYRRDGLHVMPIITPAYPSMNSTYNVGLSQLRRLQVELKRASDSLSSTTLRPPRSIQPRTYLQVGNGPSAERSEGESSNPFESLFAKSDFFARHANFLQVKIQASNEQDFLEWHRLIESRLRLLIAALETQDTQAWPYSHFFNRTYDVNDRDSSGGVVDQGSPTSRIYESSLFIGIRFCARVENANLTPLTSDFVHKVNSWPGKKGRMSLGISHVLANNLPQYCRPPPGSKIPQRAMLEYSYAAQLAAAHKENWSANCYHNHVASRGNYGKKTNGSHKYQKGSYQRKHQLHPGQSRPRHDNNHSGSDNRRNRRGNNVNGKQTGNAVDTDQLSSASSSSEHAETEETQSMASDASFGTSSTSGSLEGTEPKNKGSPMKRICVYKTTPPVTHGQGQK